MTPIQSATVYCISGMCIGAAAIKDTLSITSFIIGILVGLTALYINLKVIKKHKKKEK